MVESSSFKGVLFFLFILGITGTSCVSGAAGVIFPGDVPTGQSAVTTDDGLVRLEAMGPQDARFITGGQFIGVQSSASNRNAASDEDGELPADEYFRLSLQPGTGLEELCVIWTRATVTITGFQANPGLVNQGSTSSAYEASTGTLTIRQPWTAGNSVCYRFLRPEASSGRTLEILPLDPGNPGSVLALNAIRYVELAQRDPITTPEAYLDHFPRLLEARWPQNRTVNIVVYGGSTSLGYNEESRPGIHRSYPHYVRGLLKERYPYSVLNAIASGRYGLASPDAVETFQTSVLDRKPDLIILDFGREDIGGNLEASIDALAEMVEMATSSAVRVFLTTPPVPMSSLPESVREEDVNALAEGIRQLAENSSVALIDFQAVLNAPDEQPDSFFDAGRLSPDGHWFLAKEILKWFPDNPLAPIPGDSVRSACDFRPLECSFHFENFPEATVLLQRTHNLKRFWSTIDIVNSPNQSAFEIELPEVRPVGTMNTSASWYRVIEYKVEKALQ